MENGKLISKAKADVLPATNEILGGIKVDNINTSLNEKNELVVHNANSIKSPVLISEQEVFINLEAISYNYTNVNTWQLIPFSKITGTHSSYSTINFEYKVLHNGNYNFNFNPSTLNNTLYGIFVNGVLNTETYGQCTVFELKINDIVQLKIKSSTIISVRDYSSRIQLSSSLLKLNELNEVPPTYCCYKFRDNNNWVGISNPNNVLQKFQHKIEDNDELYNSNTGFLTIKEDGLYFISLTGFSYTTGPITGISALIVKSNNIPQDYSIGRVLNTATTLNNYSNNFSLSGIISLKMNDTLKIVISPNSKQSGNISGDTAFTFYKMSNQAEYKIRCDNLGGNIEQVLTKNSSADGDVEWKDLPYGTQIKAGTFLEATTLEILNGVSTGINHKVLTVESLKDISGIGSRGSSGYKCIYSKDYVGELGVNDIKEDKLPLNISLSSRYILTNPFGNNTPVSVEAEIFLNNKWTPTGWIYSSGSNNNSYGTKASQILGEGIVVQTALNYLKEVPLNTGTGTVTSVKTPCPCRVHIWKVGESDIPVFSGPLPDTHLFDYLYSIEYKSIMYWDNNLGFYRSDTPVDIGESIYVSDKLPKGKYALDSSGFELTSKQGKVLNSLDEDTKLRWGIDIFDNIIYLPNMYHTDGRGYYLRNGLNVGGIEEDASREMTGELIYQNNAGFPSSSFAVGHSSGVFFAGRATSYILSIQQYAGESINFASSNSTPTAPENRVLTRYITMYIDLGV